LTAGAESKSGNRTFFDAKKAIPASKISLNVSRLLTNPAWRASVLF
jgi:hypothetical protein